MPTPKMERQETHRLSRAHFANEVAEEAGGKVHKRLERKKTIVDMADRFSRIAEIAQHGTLEEKEKIQNDFGQVPSYKTIQFLSKLKSKKQGFQAGEKYLMSKKEARTQKFALVEEEEGEEEERLRQNAARHSAQAGANMQAQGGSGLDFRMKRLLQGWKIGSLQEYFLAWRAIINSGVKQGRRRLRDYVNITAKAPHRRTADELQLLDDFMVNVPFFAQLEQDVRIGCCRLLQLDEYDEDEIVFTQGDDADTMYLVLLGAVAAYEEPIESDDEDEDAGGPPGGGGKIKKKKEKKKKGFKLFPEEDEPPPPDPEEELAAQKATEEAAAKKPKQFQRSSKTYEVTLGTGDILGETELVTGKPRRSTVVVDEPTWLLALKKRDYERTLKVSRNRQVKDRMDFCCKVPLLQHATLQELNDLVTLFHEHTHPKGATIARQFDELGVISFVVSGTVEAYKYLGPPPRPARASLGPEGSGGIVHPAVPPPPMALLERRGCGAVVGAHSAINKVSHTATVVTLEETKVYTCNVYEFHMRLSPRTQEHMRAALRRDPDAAEMAEMVSERQLEAATARSMHRAAVSSGGALPEKPSPRLAPFPRRWKYHVEAPVAPSSGSLAVPPAGRPQHAARKTSKGGGGGDGRSAFRPQKYGISAAISALTGKPEDSPLAAFMHAVHAENEERRRVWVADTAKLRPPEAPRAINIMPSNQGAGERGDTSVLYSEFLPNCSLLTLRVTHKDPMSLDLVPPVVMDLIRDRLTLSAIDANFRVARHSSDMLVLLRPTVEENAQPMLHAMANAACDLYGYIYRLGTFGEIPKVATKHNKAMIMDPGKYVVVGSLCVGPLFVTWADGEFISSLSGDVFDEGMHYCKESAEIGAVLVSRAASRMLKLSHMLGAVSDRTGTRTDCLALLEKIEYPYDQTTASLFGDGAMAEAESWPPVCVLDGVAYNGVRVPRLRGEWEEGQWDPLPLEAAPPPRPLTRDGSKSNLWKTHRLRPWEPRTPNDRPARTHRATMGASLRSQLGSTMRGSITARENMSRGMSRDSGRSTASPRPGSRPATVGGALDRKAPSLYSYQEPAPRRAALRIGSTKIPMTPKGDLGTGYDAFGYAVVPGSSRPNSSGGGGGGTPHGWRGGGGGNPFVGGGGGQQGGLRGPSLRFDTAQSIGGSNLRSETQQSHGDGLDAGAWYDEDGNGAPREISKWKPPRTPGGAGGGARSSMLRSRGASRGGGEEKFSVRSMGHTGVQKTYRPTEDDPVVQAAVEEAAQLAAKNKAAGKSDLDFRLSLKIRKNKILDSTGAPGSPRGSPRLGTPRAAAPQTPSNLGPAASIHDRGSTPTTAQAAGGGVLKLHAVEGLDFEPAWLKADRAAAAEARAEAQAVAKLAKGGAFANVPTWSSMTMPEPGGSPKVDITASPAMSPRRPEGAMRGERPPPLSLAGGVSSSSGSLSPRRGAGAGEGEGGRGTPRIRTAGSLSPQRGAREGGVGTPRMGGGPVGMRTPASVGTFEFNVNDDNAVENLLKLAVPKGKTQYFAT